eukprot:4505246-Lingulodinium_polyedra.AAC.1
MAQGVLGPFLEAGRLHDKGQVAQDLLAKVLARGVARVAGEEDEEVGQVQPPSLTHRSGLSRRSRMPGPWFKAKDHLMMMDACMQDRSHLEPALRRSLTKHNNGSKGMHRPTTGTSRAPPSGQKPSTWCNRSSPRPKSFHVTSTGTA